MKKNVKIIQRFVKQNKQNLKQTPKMLDIKVNITFRNPYSEKEYNQEYNITTIFMTGGKMKIAKAIVKATNELAERIGSYPREVTGMTLLRVLVNDTPTDLTQYRDLKLYGTLLSYHGYGLVVDKQITTASCVPDYVVAILNNENEPNRNKRIMKLTRESFMLEVGMVDANEGCPLSKLAIFCDNHHITYYAIDFRFFTIEHNKDKGYGRTIIYQFYISWLLQAIYTQF